jgi:hypothetical protein
MPVIAFASLVVEQLAAMTDRSSPSCLRAGDESNHEETIVSYGF